MGNVLILMAAMNSDVDQLIKSSKITSDIVIVNQCDEEYQEQRDYGNFSAYIIHSRERGLSKSRNLALAKARELPHEIIIFADDDVTYFDGYETFIQSAYTTCVDADIITFNYKKYNKNDVHTTINECIDDNQVNIKQSKRKHKYFSSVMISVKKQFLITNNIKFNENFGAGSGKISHGEDSLFIAECRKNKAKIYICDRTILAVDISTSTWRNISNEQFFRDKGTLWKVLSPHGYYFWGIPLILKISYLMRTSFIKSYLQYLKGAKHTF